MNKRHNRKNPGALRTVRRRRKKIQPQLPRKLLFIPSSDKDFIETWKSRGKNPDPLNFPASWRMVIMGKPGVGKTCFIKNVIIRAKPPFERIFVFHQDQYAKEYDDIDAEVLTELPDNDFWMGYDSAAEEDGTDDDSAPRLEEEANLEETERPKTLCIIDDICFKDLPKAQTSKLDRLCGFISTHCNISLVCINQDFFACNAIIKKCANIFVIYRPSCTDELNTIARRCGMTSKEFKYLFDKIAPNESDSITVDKTSGTPYPLRLNGFYPINRTNRTDGSSASGFNIDE